MAETKTTGTKKTTAKKTTKKVAEPVTEVVETVETPVQEAPKKATKKTTKKVDEVKETKPAVTEARATATNLRLTPRKARLVIDLVRGKDVKLALAILSNTNRAACAPVAKLIKSAVANATNNFGMDKESLYIASIWANDGLKMKRYMPRAKGSASGLVKRNCHITVVVKMR
ncbi:MAG: 50S ribosomal protein L22 [Bacilli bacterium]|nr:50S ribosomal protein L22 [Bacilli bacterium]